MVSRSTIQLGFSESGAPAGWALEKGRHPATSKSWSSRLHPSQSRQQNPVGMVKTKQGLWQLNMNQITKNPPIWCQIMHCFELLSSPKDLNPKDATTTFLRTDTATVVTPGHFPGTGAGDGIALQPHHQWRRRLKLAFLMFLFLGCFNGFLLFFSLVF